MRESACMKEMLTVKMLKVLKAGLHHVVLWSVFNVAESCHCFMILFTHLENESDI